MVLGFVLTLGSVSRLRSVHLRSIKKMAVFLAVWVDRGSTRASKVQRAHPRRAENPPLFSCGVKPDFPGATTDRSQIIHTKKAPQRTYLTMETTEGDPFRPLRTCWFSLGISPLMIDTFLHFMQKKLKTLAMWYNGNRRSSGQCGIIDARPSDCGPMPLQPF